MNERLNNPEVKAAIELLKSKGVSFDDIKKVYPKGKCDTCGCLTDGYYSDCTPCIVASI